MREMGVKKGNSYLFLFAMAFLRFLLKRFSLHVSDSPRSFDDRSVVTAACGTAVRIEMAEPGRVLD